MLKPRAETVPGPLARAGAALGDASYAFYLCHPMVMSAFAALWYALGVQHLLPARAGVAIAVALSALAALIVYRWFERPVTQYLHRDTAPDVGRQHKQLRQATPTAAPH